MSKVISFDQSTRVSGWSLFEDGEYVCSGIVDMQAPDAPPM